MLFSLIDYFFNSNYIMNYTPLDEAYTIHHVNTNTYSGPIKYDPTCIYCKCSRSTPLMNDGGSFRRCEHCKKNFRATIVSKPISNFVNSTNHLKGTN